MNYVLFSPIGLIVGGSLGFMVNTHLTPRAESENKVTVNDKAQANMHYVLHSP